jgi:hypothetical protein
MVKYHPTQAPNIKVMALVPSRPLKIYCLTNVTIEGGFNHSTVTKHMALSMVWGYNKYLIYEL